MGKEVFSIVNRVLVNYCAPVLLKKKPAALFTLKTRKCLMCLKNVIEDRLIIEVLRENRNGTLVIVYDPGLLMDFVLNDTDIQYSLLKLGYPDEISVKEYLAYLKYRFNVSGSFPHEVGFFLGYPPSDVLSFILNNGQQYKCCGAWKVYGNENHSLQRFKEYEYCTKRLKSHFDSGGTLKDFKAAESINKMKTGGFYE